jgi:hypothetical protein
LSPCDNYDRKTRDFADNKVALLAAVTETEGTSFLLIPTKGRKVSVIHSLFLVDPEEKKTSIVGTLGTRKNATFQVRTCRPG